MAPGIARALRPVLHGAGSLRWEILKQGTAQCHIDQLNTAANAQDWDPALPGHRKERELKQISLPTGRIEVGRRPGAVPGRVDVLTTGEQQAVDPIEGSSRHRGAHQWREHQRDPPCDQYGSNVGGVDPGTLRPIPASHHSAHADPRRHHWITESGKNGQRGSSIRAGSSWIPMSGTVVLPTDTVPIWGAPSTGVPS